MDLQLKNRVALVAGSSRGIGKAIALALLREGCRVCITGRDATSLEATDQQLRAIAADRVLAFAGDLTEKSAIDAALRAIEQQWGSLDILVANLGSSRGAPGWQLDEDEWQRLFNMNLFGSVRLAQAIIPIMRPRGGSILFIASIAAVESTPAPLPYSSAKSALVNYSNNLSRIVAEDKIRVNCLAPGNIRFPGGNWDRHLENRREQVEHYIATEVPQKRFGKPEEIADFAAFLVSPLAGFATGGCYIVDGGQTRAV